MALAQEGGGSTAHEPRVLILSHMYPSSLDPVHGTFIHEHVRALRCVGVSLHVVSPVPWAPRPLWFQERWKRYGQTRLERDWDGHPIVRPAYPAPPTAILQPFSGPAMAAAIAGPVRRLQTRTGFNLIHAHCVTPDGFAAVALGRWLGVPTVVSARGSDVHYTPALSAAHRWAARVTLRGCDRFLAVSGALAASAETLAERDLHPTVIYNGVDARRFFPATDPVADRRALDLEIDRTWILCVAQCDVSKGIRELYRAFATLDGEPGLIVAGDGNLRSWLADRARSDRAESRVRTLGRVPPDVVAQYMRAADIFTLPSYAEGMPNTMLEAMASGLPVVVTSVGGVPEIVEDGWNGIMVPPRDDAALAAALARLCANPDRRAELGRAGRETVLRRLTWQENARAHLAVYHELMRQTRARSCLGSLLDRQ